MLYLLLPKSALAHCPLCTASAGVGALLAKEIGMKSSAIGIFIGAFAVALGLWLANVLRRKINFKFLTSISILISFLTISLPLKTYLYDNGSFYLSLFGDYGSLFNRTYVYDKFLIGSFWGALIMFLGPSLSKKLIKITGKVFPFQGLIMTFLLLIIFAIGLQIWL